MGTPTNDLIGTSGMTGENIICFSKDWSEEPTSNNHIMQLLARQNRVLWINSVSMRAPSLASKRDISKIFRKLKGFAGGLKPIHERLWVFTPLVLPFPHSRAARAVNHVILSATIRYLRCKLRMRDFQLWTFLPNVADYVGSLGESVSVYYCVDEWTGFTGIDGEKIAAEERVLCERADVVFAACSTLAERKQQYRPDVHTSTHGVDRDLFATALEVSTRVPDDLARLPGPVLGFVGTIQDWVDLDLIDYLAEAHPKWSIALLGRVFVDVSRLENRPNVHFLGRKSHAELPAYYRGFAVGLIPYLLTERMRYVNPLKLREYLSAGLPVVSTAVPEVRRYSSLCAVAESREQFEQAIVDALRSDSPALRRARSHAMREETWERKVQEIGRIVTEAKDNRCRKQRSTAPAL